MNWQNMARFRQTFDLFKMEMPACRRYSLRLPMILGSACLTLIQSPFG